MTVIIQIGMDEVAYISENGMDEVSYKKWIRNHKDGTVL